MSLKSLDAQCLAAIVQDDAVAFSFAGGDYIGTPGPRDTMLSLTEGGRIADNTVTLLVEVSQFATVTAPTQEQKISLALDANGVPCGTSEEASRVTMRIKRITRAQAGLTFELRTEAR